MHKFGLVLSGLTAVTIVHAASPVSYDMLNGNGVASGGSFNYWDLGYTGAGQTNVDNSPLSGGLGDLTDGIIATDNWFAVENVAGTGPYVGWRDLNPVITFNFAGVQSINGVTIYADDSDGNGGVSLPDGVVINGTLYDVDETLFGSEPKALAFTNLGLNTDTVTVELIRSNAWVFVSEVEFDAVPEPTSLAALALGAGFLATRARRRKA